MSRTRRDHSIAEHQWLGLADEKLGRDKKPGSKPAAWFKRERRRRKRRREAHAMRCGRIIERRRRNNEFTWN
ncbi:MAG: hypothetical protein KKE73_10835 [Proteobacteria bacterium]|nr:hypothetical protein [Pseudomonadota bacterium]